MPALLSAWRIRFHRSRGVRLRTKQQIGEPRLGHLLVASGQLLRLGGIGVDRDHRNRRIIHGQRNLVLTTEEFNR